VEMKEKKRKGKERKEREENRRQHIRKTKRSTYRRPLSILARGLSELSLSSLNSFMRSCASLLPAALPIVQVQEG
jgi:hypothetical protein